jgi:hypothetical protein
VEPGFTENDELWQLDGGDIAAGQARSVLDTIFSNSTTCMCLISAVSSRDDEETDIAVTAHGRIIAGIMGCLGVFSGVLPHGGGVSADDQRPKLIL